MKTIVHVNQHIIRANLKHNRTDPPLTVRRGRKTIRCGTALVRDSEGSVIGRFYYRPDKPLSCGARVWFELEDAVSVTPEEES